MGRLVQTFVAVSIAAGGLAALSLSAQAAALPNGRGYELVTPSQKNGGEVGLGGGSMFAAPAGDAVAFDSPVAFPDAQGTGVVVRYASRRSASGWSTEALTPKQSANPLGLFSGTRYFGESISSDFSKGVLRAGDPPLVPGAPEQVINLYLRDNATGSYTLLSKPFQALPPNAFSAPWFTGASKDFSHIAFELQKQLTPDATDFDTNLYEFVGGEVRLAGILPNGDPAPNSQAGNGGLNSYDTHNTMSADGSKLVFTSPTFGTTRVYVRVNGTSTVEASESERATPDPAGPQPATFQTSTPNGRYVFFTTLEQLTDDDADAGPDLYRYDTSRPATDPHNLTRISVDGEPVDGSQADAAGMLGASEDGSVVYFAAAGRLVAGQAPPGDFTFNLYRWDNGTITFVATVANEVPDEDNWLPKQPDLGRSLTSRVSPDGATLLFSSVRSVTGYDNVNFDACNSSPTGGCKQLYVYQAGQDTGDSADTDGVTCASCPSDGAKALGPVNTTQQGFGASLAYSNRSRALSSDGSRVYFDTPNSLVSEDGNGKRDVYQWEDGRLSLLTGGTSKDDSYFADASETGDDVFVLTRDRLVKADIDANLDMYDVRVGGGFPDASDGAAPCVGDGCQGSPTPPPADPDPGSTQFSGPGNQPLVAPAAKPVMTVKPVSAKQRAAWAKSGRVTMSVRVSEAGRVSVVATGKVAGTTSVVAKGARSAASGGAVSVALRLSESARRQLRKSGRLPVTIAATFSKARGTQRAALTLTTATKKGASK
jgi:hypothetical protein